MALNALDLHRIQGDIHSRSEHSKQRHTRRARFNVIVDGWDTIDVVPWDGASGTLGTSKATLLSDTVFTENEVKQLQFQFNKAFTQSHAVKGKPRLPYEGRAWSESSVQMTEDGTFETVSRFVVSLPRLQDIPGHEELKLLATSRSIFEGGPRIVSVPVTMTITAPKLIFQTEVKLIYTSGRMNDFEILRSPLQKRALTLVESDWFHVVVAGMICLNCMALAANQPSNESAHSIVIVVEVAASIFFALEAAVAIYALTWPVYIASNWHKLDIVVAMEGAWFVIAHFTGGEAVDISALRILRVLRPLRTISHIPRLQEAVEVIISALPSICNSVLLYLVFLVFSAIFMLQLAVHSLEYTCKGPKYDSLEQPTFCSPNPRSGCIPGLFVPFDCDGHPEACTRATPKDQPIYPNFDDFAESLLTIFRISTLDGWAPALWHLQNAVGANVVFIFVVIIVLGPCVVVNLCIAAVLKHYSLVSMKKSQKKKDEEDVLTQLKMPSNHEKDLQDDICPACGALYSPDALYCRKCGISKVHSITSSDYDDNSSIGSTGKSERSTLVQKKNIWICTPRKEAVDWWHKNVNCHLSYGGLKNEKLRRIAGDEFSIFNQFMNLVICANVIMMACESFGQSTDVDKGIKTANVVFTVTFLLEMIFKVVVLGPGEMLEYGRSPIAVIDLFVVVLSTISLVFNSKSSSSVSVLRLLKLGRALRVLRMSRVSKRWHQVVAVVQLMRSSISRVWPMLFLFLLFLFMSTILAMQIFGDIERDGNFGFRTFGQSISMCFFVIALEDWGDVLEFANNGRRNGPQTLFFVAIVLFGQLLLLNLVLATIVDGAVEIFEDAFVRQEIISRVKQHLHRQTLHVSFHRFWNQTSRVRKRPRVIKGEKLHHLICSCGCMLKDDSLFCRKCGYSRAELLREVLPLTTSKDPAEGEEDIKDEAEEENSKKFGPVMSLRRTLVKNFSSREELPLPETTNTKIVWKWDRDKLTYVNINALKIVSGIDQSLVGFSFQAHEETNSIEEDTWGDEWCCRRTRSSWRQWCSSLDKFWAWNLWMDFILFFSILTLIIADDQLAGSSRCFRRGPWPIMDAITVFFFCVETIARGGARGVWHGTKPLLRDPWMIMEIIINMFGLLHLGTAIACRQSPNATVAFRCVRALRPLRFVHRNKDLHRTFHSIVKSIQGLASVVCLILMFLFGFSIIGMQLWMGQFWACEDEFPEGMHKEGELLKGSNDEYVEPPCKRWKNADFNYDNFPNAMMASFTFLTGGWSGIWISATNIYAVDHEPVVNYSFGYVPIFLFSIFVFDMYLKNLFIGIVFDSYLKIYHKEESTGRILSTPERRFKHYSQSVLKGLTPLRPDPHISLRPRWLRNYVDSPTHANMICGTLLVNLVLLCIISNGMPLWLQWVCSIGNILVTVVFVVDFFAMMYAYGPRQYFSNWQFVFDFVVTVTSALDTGLELAAGFEGQECPTLAVLRALRVLRLIKLLKHLPGVEIFISSVVSALPSIRDLTILLFILIIVTASMGSAIFRSRYENGLEAGIFSTAWKKHSNFGRTSSAMVELFVLVTGDQWEGEMFEQKEASTASGRSNDNWQIFLFHSIFQVLGQCLFLNLFIMIVVEAYEVLDDDKRAVADSCVQDYLVAWEKLDPNGTGEIAPKLLPTLLLLMQPPIGLQGHTSRLVIASHVHVLESMHGLRYEFDWILRKLLLLYVYDDHDSLERIEWSRNTVAMECCKRSFRRMLTAARQKRRANSRPPPSTLESFLHAVGLTAVQISEDSESETKEATNVSRESDEYSAYSAYSDFTELASCSRVDE